MLILKKLWALWAKAKIVSCKRAANGLMRLIVARNSIVANTIIKNISVVAPSASTQEGVYDYLSFHQWTLFYTATRLSKQQKTNKRVFGRRFAAKASKFIHGH